MNIPWAFQVVRFERPHGERSSWSPAAVFPHGPDHFGILFLAQETPLYVEHLKLIHLDQSSYAVRTVVRKLMSGKLNAVLSVNDKPEGRVPVSLTKPLSVLFLPVEIDRTKLTYSPYYGQMTSKPVSYNVFAAWDKTPQTVMLADKRFLKESGQSGMIMPGVNDRNAVASGSEEFGVRSLVPETEVILAGRRALAVKFNLPFGRRFPGQNQVHLAAAHHDAEQGRGRNESVSRASQRGIRSRHRQPQARGVCDRSGTPRKT